MNNYIISYQKMLNDALNQINLFSLEEVKRSLLSCANNNKTIFVCGNGGSSAISEHLSCDHMKGIRTDTEVHTKVISLTSNVSLLTAIANDFGYEYVFSKQLEWYGSENCVLFVISSSGNSKNVVTAIKTAKELNIKTISFVGFDGGECKKLSDICIHVNSNNYGIVEDCHQILMHSLAQDIRLEYSFNKKIIL